MTRKFKSVTALSVFGALLGCAQIAPSSSTTGQPGAARAPQEKMPVKVAAGPAVPKGASGADVLFSVGRYAHGAGQLAQASLHYAQALELDPEHVGALNAMAVIHAQAGRTDEALALFERAARLSPKAAHVHNNLGYALMRAGRLDEAGVQLRQAQALDPGSLQAAQNLALLENERSKGRALAAHPDQPRIDETERSSAQLVAVAPNVFELRMPVAQAAPSPVAPAVEARAPQPVAPLLVVQPAMPVHVQAATPVVVSAGSPATEQRAVQPLVTPGSALPGKVNQPLNIPTALAGQPGADALKGVRLEVSNGVGITHLARRTADRLAPTGVITARLSNALPYRQARTEIQFLAGLDLPAQALQAQLPVTARAVASSGLQRGVQIRLVLGHDVAGRAIASWLDVENERIAKVPALGGWVLG